jgi:hypothetical protein
MAKVSRNKEPFNFPKGTKLFSKGCSSVIDKEISGSFDDGYTVDNLNCRPTSDEGNYGSLERINGEELLYSSQVADIFNDYICIGVENIKNRIVEFWASPTEDFPNIVRIDGRIVLLSSALNFSHSIKLEIDKNENIDRGEIFVNDKVQPPIYFSIGDMLDNSINDTAKYFADFNRSLYEVNLKLPFNVLKFEDIVNVGSGGGLPVGQYAYQYRLRNSGGDKTNWSISTPNIFIPERYVTASQSKEPFPYIDTYGNNPNPTQSSPYAVKLKLRINNIYNYNYIELKRIPYNSGEGLDYRPQTYIVQRILITPGQFSVITIIDSIVNQTDMIPISDEEEESVMSVIKSIESIKYFGNKIVGLGVEYESREVDGDSVVFKESENENIMYPVVKTIGTKGYNNVLNHANKMSLMHNERYSWKLIFWDENFQRTFTVDIPGFDNKTMPSKRDPLEGDSLANSTVFPLQCTDKNSVDGEVVPTFEVVHYGLGVDGSSFIGQKERGEENVVEVNISNTEDDNGIIEQNASGVGYKPRRPVSKSDRKSNRYINASPDTINNPANPDDTTEVTINNSVMYMSLGMQLEGLLSYPSFAKAFSVVRSKRANRVVAQGFASYKLTNADALRVPETGHQYLQGVTKSLDTISCHFVDFENGIVPASEIDNFLNNPTQYKIQVCEPLGIQTEVFSGVGNPLTETDYDVIPTTQVDMLSYANVQKYPNPDGIVGDFGVNEEVAFGKYLNDEAPDVFQDISGGGSPIQGINGNHLFSIDSVTIDVANEEGKVNYDIKLTENIYKYSTSATPSLVNYPVNPFVQNFLEPFYIINIIKEEASVPDRSFAEYFINGNYTKFESIVGYATAEAIQEFEIVDERVVDFHREDADDILHNVVYIRDKSSQLEVAYVNQNYMTGGEIATANNDITTGSTDLIGIPIKGFYTSTENSIIFDDSISVNMPAVGDAIIVKYNNLRPVEVFNGDTFIGEALFPFVHRRSANNGRTSPPTDVEKYTDYKQCLLLGTAFPHYEYWRNDNVFVAIQDKTNFNTDIVKNNRIKLDVIRQLVFRYSVMSRANIALSHGDFYPLINYIERPATWTKEFSSTEDSDLFWREYFEDYPNENFRWVLGGIQLEQYPINIDYAKLPIHQLAYSKSDIEYEESTVYKNRVIWSETRPGQIQSSSNLRSFKPFSYKDISDKYGAGKKLFIANTSNGDNLYAICEEDIAVLLTRKKVLTGAAGETVGMTSDDDANFISQEIWLGLREQSILEENFVSSYRENANEFFFCNRDGVFKFKDNKLENLDQKYRDIIYSDFLNKYYDSGNGGDIVTCYDSRYDEYWIQYNQSKFEIKEIDYTYSQIALPAIVLAERYNLDEYPDGSIIRFSDNTILNTVEPYESGGIYSQSNAGFWIKSNRSGSWYLQNSSLVPFNLIVAETADVLPNLTDSVTTVAAGASVLIKYDMSQTPVFGNQGIRVSITVVDSKLVARTNENFVYCNQTEVANFIGRYSYKFDQYLSFNNRTFGFRGLKTYELHKGNTINGETITMYVADSFNPGKSEFPMDKELRKVQVASTISPFKIDVFTTDDFTTPASTIVQADMKFVGGWGNLVNRTSGGNRIQGRYFNYKITFINTVRAVVKSATLQFRILK